MGTFCLKTKTFKMPFFVFGIFFERACDLCLLTHNFSQIEAIFNRSLESPWISSLLSVLIATTTTHHPPPPPTTIDGKN
jgi:hypothetical protein